MTWNSGSNCGQLPDYIGASLPVVPYPELIIVPIAVHLKKRATIPHLLRPPSQSKKVRKDREDEVRKENTGIGCYH